MNEEIKKRHQELENVIEEELGLVEEFNVG